MKLLATLVLLCSSSVSFAVTIDLIDTATGSPYEFAATANQAGFTGTFTSNLASATEAMTDLYGTSYVLSPVDNVDTSPAYVDLMFGDGTNNVNLLNGAGSDLSIFFVAANPHQISLTLFNTIDNVDFGTMDFSNLVYTENCIDNSNDGISCAPGNALDYPIYEMSIDFALFGITTEEIDMIRMDLSDKRGIPSLVGANYTTSAMAVPLPLPALLLASGLSVLGLFTRRRKTA